jgi:hypothetical protein
MGIARAVASLGEGDVDICERRELGSGVPIIVASPYYGLFIAPSCLLIPLQRDAYLFPYETDCLSRPNRDQD